jgi:aminopeptidase N
VNKRNLLALTMVGLCSVYSIAQNLYVPDPNLDVAHYIFEVEVFENSAQMSGKATIQFSLSEGKTIQLDLVNDNGTTGMMVDEVTLAGQSVDFQHENDKLTIANDGFSNTGKNEIVVTYAGTPASGLITGESIFEDWVYFGDNYPDRARNWLPAIDHPSDKATVTWKVTVPEAYRVIASGSFINEQVIDNNRKTFHYNEEVPISTKVMVFGAANFAVDSVGFVKGVPVTTWVYEQNKAEGFVDFDVATKVLAFLDSLIGDYPYEKLANVQSKTTYGGMENAGNIFYFEKSVNGKQEREGLIVHEEAHQWFGNSVTEADWPHAWLSEGFASYMTHYYFEAYEGKAVFEERMAKDRTRVIEFYKKTPLPIVNEALITSPAIKSLRELLSTNTYQKGSWVLHMLRHEIGDELFWKTIRSYYAQYKNGNATTEDFQQVAEQISGKDLGVFFKQWLYRAGQPELRGTWNFNKGEIGISIQQRQEMVYSIPITVGLVYDNELVLKTIVMDERTGDFSFEGEKPTQILLDPEVNLLFDGPKQLISEER